MPGSSGKFSPALRTGRASLVHWRKDRSPLTFQQHHDEPGRLGVAGIAPHDVNIGGPLVECLAGLERNGRLAFNCMMMWPSST